MSCPPVMICGFIRPDCLRRVFERVRAARPSQLFLVLDAPRESSPNDLSRYDECRKIFENIDWECEVYRNYADKNMGCRNRMASGITWTFEHVEYAVILEDDCVADLSFFVFCKELLEKYRHDAKIGGICGYAEHPSFVEHPVKCDADYYFDHLNTCCGWATWRRAWQSFDMKMSKWSEQKKNRLFKKICCSRYEEKCFERMVDDVYAGKCSSWATVWFVSALDRGYLFAHAVNNLISNIGFGEGATHTNCGGMMVVRPTVPVLLPIRHPTEVSCNRKVERFMITHQYAIPVGTRIVSKLLRCLKVKGSR